MTTRRSVLSTEFAGYFEDDDAAGSAPLAVEVLDRAEAGEIWTRRFDGSSASYSSLPDDSWVVASEWTTVGGWHDAYNSDDPGVLGAVLSSACGWAEDAPVLFCVSKYVMLSCTWRQFVDHWDCFLALDDDSPLLVREDDEEELFWFTPRGSVRFGRRRR